MRAFHAGGRALVAPVIAVAMAMAMAPVALADPTGTPVGADTQSDNPAAAACGQFATGLDLAATYYSDFANNIAGDAPPNYTSPIVVESNVTGRTALRQAAAEALSASGTPGLQPEIANPMRAWSMSATKLLLLMGLHTGVDTINGSATDLNNNTNKVQMACAAAGTHA